MIEFLITEQISTLEFTWILILGLVGVVVRAKEKKMDF